MREEIYFENKMIKRNEHGYLCNYADWNPDIAELFATEEDLSLSAEHWEIILFLRQFYVEYEMIPPMRVLVKIIAKELGLKKGDSSYLQRLFPKGFLKQSCKIAGLPKPRHCL